MCVCIHTHIYVWVHWYIHMYMNMYTSWRAAKSQWYKSCSGITRNLNISQMCTFVYIHTHIYTCMGIMWEKKWVSVKGDARFTSPSKAYCNGSNDFQTTNKVLVFKKKLCALVWCHSPTSDSEPITSESASVSRKAWNKVTSRRPSHLSRLCSPWHAVFIHEQVIFIKCRKSDD